MCEWWKMKVGVYNKKSHSIEWLLSGYPDSNWGPPAPKAGALTNCATPRSAYPYRNCDAKVQLFFESTNLSAKKVCFFWIFLVFGLKTPEVVQFFEKFRLIVRGKY